MARGNKNHSKKYIAILVTFLLITTTFSSIQAFENNNSKFIFDKYDYKDNQNEETKDIISVKNNNNQILNRSRNLPNLIKTFILKILERFQILRSIPIFEKLLKLYGTEENGDVGESGYTSNDDVEIFPEAGHIRIRGNGTLIINTTLDIERKWLVKLQGKLFLSTDAEAIHIWWNLSTGFLKINASSFSQDGSPYFTLEDFLIEIKENNTGDENKITFTVGSLSIDASACIILNQNLTEGSVDFSGIFELSNFNFSVSSFEYNNATISGTVSLSAGLEGDLSIEWSETDFTIDGVISGELYLDILDFSLIHSNFSFEADRIKLYGRLSVDFTDIGSSVFVTLSSQHVEITALSIKFGDYFISDASLVVDGTIQLVLQIVDIGEEYIFGEEGHITISGNAKIDISAYLNLNGTDVYLVGNFTLETASEQVDIWWDVEEGYVKVDGTAKFTADNFHLHVEDIMNIDISHLLLDAGAYIYLKKNLTSGHIDIEGTFELELFSISSDMDNDLIQFSGEIDLSVAVTGRLNIIWSEENVKIDCALTAGLGLTIKNLYFSNENISASVDLLRFNIQGYLNIKFNKNNEELNVEISGVGVEIEVNELNLVSPDFSITTEYLFAKGAISGSFYDLSNFEITADAYLIWKELKVVSSEISGGFELAEFDGEGDIYVYSDRAGGSASAELTIKKVYLNGNLENISGSLSLDLLYFSGAGKGEVIFGDEFVYFDAISLSDVSLEFIILNLEIDGIIQGNDIKFSGSGNCRGSINLELNSERLNADANGQGIFYDIYFQSNNLKITLTELSFEAAGNVSARLGHLAGSLSASGKLVLKDLSASMSGVGSLSLQYLEIAASVAISVYETDAHVMAGGYIELRSLSIDANSLSLDVDYARANAAFELYVFEGGLSGSASGELTIDGFRLVIPSLLVSWEHLYAVAGLQITILESGISGSAAGELTIDSFKLAIPNLTVTWAHLFVRGAISASFNGLTLRIEASLYLVLIDLDIISSQISGGCESAELRGQGYVYISSNKAGAGGSAELTVRNAYLNVRGDVSGNLKVNLVYLSGAGEGEVTFGDEFVYFDALSLKNANIQIIIDNLEIYDRYDEVKKFSASANFRGSLSLDLSAGRLAASASARGSISDVFVDLKGLDISMANMGFDAAGSVSVNWEEENGALVVDGGIGSSGYLSINDLKFNGKSLEFDFHSLNIGAQGSLTVGGTFNADPQSGEAHIEASGHIDWSLSGTGAQGHFSSEGSVDVSELTIDVGGSSTNDNLILNFDATLNGYASGVSFYKGGNGFEIGSAEGSGLLTTYVSLTPSTGTLVVNADGSISTSGVHVSLSGSDINLDDITMGGDGDIAVSWDATALSKSVSVQSAEGISANINFYVANTCLISISGELPSGFDGAANFDWVWGGCEILGIELPSMIQGGIDTEGKSFSLLIETQQTKLNLHGAASDFSYFYEPCKPPILPDTSGILSLSGSLHAIHEGEWKLIWPIEQDGICWLWGKGPEDDEWKRGDKLIPDVVQMEEPGRVDFQGYYVLDLNEDSGSGNNGNNGNSDSSESNEINNDIISVLADGSGDDEIYLQFFYGDGNRSDLIKASETEVKGPLGIKTYPAFFAGSNWEYEEPGVYTAIVEASNSEGNILGSGSIVVEIGAFDVILEAHDGEDWQDEECKIRDWSEDDPVNVPLRVTIDTEGDDYNPDDYNNDDQENNNYQVSSLSDDTYIYEFDFGDGSPVETSNPTESTSFETSHSYEPNATYVATVTVTKEGSDVSVSDTVIIDITLGDFQCNLWIGDNENNDYIEVDVDESVDFHAKWWYEDESYNNDNNADSEINEGNVNLLSVLDDGDTFTFEVKYSLNGERVIIGQDSDTSATEWHGSHSFIENGTYIVMLHVLDSNNKDAYDSVTVKVGKGLNVKVRANPKILLQSGASSTITAEVSEEDDSNNNYNNEQTQSNTNNNLILFSLSGSNYEYTFAFGDGDQKVVTDSSNLHSEIHSYYSDKLISIFKVTVYVEDTETGASGSDSAYIFMINLDAWLTASPNPVKVDEQVTFTARADGNSNNNNNDYTNGQSNSGLILSSLDDSSEEFLYEFNFGDSGGGSYENNDYSQEGQESEAIQNDFVFSSLSDSDDNYLGTLSQEVSGVSCTAHHTYSEEGTYVATVTITHVESGVSDSASVNVEVVGDLIADAGGPYSGSTSVTIGSGSTGSGSTGTGGSQDATGQQGQIQQINGGTTTAPTNGGSVTVTDSDRMPILSLIKNGPIKTRLTLLFYKLLNLINQIRLRFTNQEINQASSESNNILSMSQIDQRETSRIGTQRSIDTSVSGDLSSGNINNLLPEGGSQQTETSSSNTRNPVVTSPGQSEPTITEPSTTNTGTTNPVSTVPSATTPSTSTTPITTAPSTTTTGTTTPVTATPSATSPTTTSPTTTTSTNPGGLDSAPSTTITPTTPTTITTPTDEGSGGGSATAYVTIYFDGSGSQPKDQIKKYHWDFGDGNSKTRSWATCMHTYVITVGSGGGGSVNTGNTGTTNYNNVANLGTIQTVTTSPSMTVLETAPPVSSNPITTPSTGSSGGGSTTYDDVRTFTVTLTVEDEYGNTATDTAEVTITIHVTVTSSLSTPTTPNTTNTPVATPSTPVNIIITPTNPITPSNPANPSNGGDLS